MGPASDGDAATEFAVDPAKFREAFAADLPEEQTAVMAATQRPVAEAAFSEASGAPAWKNGVARAPRHAAPEGSEEAYSEALAQPSACRIRRATTAEADRDGRLVPLQRLPVLPPPVRAALHRGEFLLLPVHQQWPDAYAGAVPCAF
jgi:hypothetical protein